MSRIVLPRSAGSVQARRRPLAWDGQRGETGAFVRPCGAGSDQRFSAPVNAWRSPARRSRRAAPVPFQKPHRAPGVLRWPGVWIVDSTFGWLSRSRRDAASIMSGRSLPLRNAHSGGNYLAACHSCFRRVPNLFPHTLSVMWQAGVPSRSQRNAGGRVQTPVLGFPCSSPAAQIPLALSR